MNKYRRFVVYPIKHGDTSSFGIVEYDKGNEIAGRYGVYVGPASHTDIFREYSKFIIGLLECDEQAIVQSYHRTITKKRHEFPRLRYAVRSEVKRFSYCYHAARIAQITQTNMHEIIN
jgi:hypothetical protein